jgi:hypothetical protein
MKRHIVTAHGAAAALAAILLICLGCRHTDLARELRERELRLQEDELYRVHDVLAERERLLEATRSENEALKRDLAQARGTPGGVVPVIPPAPLRNSIAPPERTAPPEVTPPQIEIAPPTIEVPRRDNAPSARSPNGPAARKSPRGVRPASHEEPIAATDSEKTTPARGVHVAKIGFNRPLTGGFNADAHLGDEGVRALIELDDERDRAVSQAGDLSVVVVDPALTGPKARVARWDFNAADCRKFMRKTAVGEGIQLELLWPGQPPAHERLVLFARFTTADGKSLEASQEILVDLARDVPDASESDARARPTAHRPSTRQWSAER